MENAVHQVVGIQVSRSSKSRTVRLNLLLENNEALSLEMPLPTASRLTDQLVDTEFMERRGADLEALRHVSMTPP